MLEITMEHLLQLSRGNRVTIEGREIGPAKEMPADLGPMLDHELCRLQVGPDGVVPGNTVEGLALWHAEAVQLRARVIGLQSALMAILQSDAVVGEHARAMKEIAAQAMREFRL